MTPQLTRVLTLWDRQVARWRDDHDSAAAGCGRRRRRDSAVGSNTAAGYQLATDDPVMSIGGFNGTDPAPTLADFEQLVHEHGIHYFTSAAR